MSGLFSSVTLVSYISGFISDSSLVTLGSHLNMSTVLLWYSVPSGTLIFCTLWYSIHASTLYALVLCILCYSGILLLWKLWDSIHSCTLNTLVLNTLCHIGRSGTLYILLLWYSVCRLNLLLHITVWYFGRSDGRSDTLYILLLWYSVYSATLVLCMQALFVAARYYGTLCALVLCTLCYFGRSVLCIFCYSGNLSAVLTCCCAVTVSSGTVSLSVVSLNTLLNQNQVFLSHSFLE